MVNGLEHWRRSLPAVTAGGLGPGLSSIVVAVWIRRQAERPEAARELSVLCPFVSTGMLEVVGLRSSPPAEGSVPSAGNCELRSLAGHDLVDLVAVERLVLEEERRELVEQLAVVR